MSVGKDEVPSECVRPALVHGLSCPSAGLHSDAPHPGSAPVA